MNRNSRLKKNFIFVLILFFLGCEGKNPTSTKNDLNNMLNDIAENYVKLTLAIGTIDENFVDAFYGSEKFLPDESLKKLSKDSLLNFAEQNCNSLLDRLDSLANQSGDEIERMRYTFLYRQLLSIKARIFILRGGSFTFAEEAKALYDISLPNYEQKKYLSILKEMESLLGSNGTYAERFENLEKKFLVPKEKIEEIFSLCIEECRKRTMSKILIPADENFEVEIVNDKSWSAYNWYKGNYKSLIQVNTTIQPTIDRLLHLAAHEGFPGHHVYNSLLEKHLVKKRGWVEFSVYPLFSPQSLIAEGTADFGMSLIFPNNSAEDFIKNILCAKAGIDTSGISNYFKIQKLKSQLDDYVVAIAQKYLDGEITKEEAIEMLMRFTLSSKPRAEQRIKFFETYRSYIVNYSLGEKLVAEYIESNSSNAEEKWKNFEKILRSPTTSSYLKPKEAN